MADGFTGDGFIDDQNYMGAYRYRGMGSDINGCGWIAAYNLLHGLGFRVGFEAVYRDMDAMFPLKIPGPTPDRILKRYLSRFVSLRVLRGRDGVLAGGGCRAGILRYWEGKEPHFVTYLRREDGRFRFLNAADGLEDFCAPLEDFLRERAPRGSVRAFAVF